MTGTALEHLRARNREKTARYRERHPDRVKSSQKRSNAKQWAKAEVRSKALSRLREYFRANPERQRAAVEKYGAANPERYRIAAHNRRARLRENGGKLSFNIVETLMKMQRGKCNCCDKLLGDDYELDHFIPVSKGGRNVDSNMQLLTTDCNRRKHDKMPEEWLRIQNARR